MTDHRRVIAPDRNGETDALPTAVDSRIAVMLLAIGAVSILPVSLYAPKALVVIFATCAIAALVCLARNRTRLRVTAPAVGMAALAFLAVISAMWSVSPGESLRTSVSFGATLIGAYVLVHFAALLTPSAKRTLGYAVFAGGMIGLVVLFGDVVVHALNPPRGTHPHPQAAANFEAAATLNYWNARKAGLVAATLFIWPWMLIALRSPRKSLVMAMVAALAAIVLFGGSGSAKIALGLGAAFAGLVYAFDRHAIRGLSVGLVLLVLAAPILTSAVVDPREPDARYERLSESAVHRLLIWMVASERISERPVLGHGFDSSRALPDATDRRSITLLPGSDRSWSILSELIPLHPHNVMLQIWLELGLVGAVVMSAFLVSITQLVQSHFPDKLARSLAMGAFVNALVVALVSYGAWQSWWLALLILIATFLAIPHVRPDHVRVG